MSAQGQVEEDPHRPIAGIIFAVLIVALMAIVIAIAVQITA